MQSSHLPSSPTSLENLLPLMQEVFAYGGEFSLLALGDSMLPMLRGGRDTLLLSAPPTKLHKYDIPLCRREDGSFVLHRVIQVKHNKYKLCGDHQAVAEYVAHGQVVAVLSAYIRNGRRIGCRTLRMRIYAFVITTLRPLRLAYFFCTSWLKRR